MKEKPFRINKMTMISNVLSKSPLTKELANEIETSLKIGKILAPIAHRVRLAIDLGAGKCRLLDNCTLVISVENAAQLSKLKQLRQSIISSLVAHDFMITEVKFQVVPKPETKEPLYTPAPIVDNITNLESAWTIIEHIDEVPEILKENFKKIAKNLRPSPDKLRSYMASRLDEEMNSIFKVQASLKVTFDSVLPPIPISFYIDNNKKTDPKKISELEKECKNYSKFKGAFDCVNQELKCAVQDCMIKSMSLKSDENENPPKQDEEKEFLSILKKSKEAKEKARAFLNSKDVIL